MANLVLHLSQTPLAGAPDRLAKAIDGYTDYASLAFFEMDYKGNKSNKLARSAICLGEDAAQKDEIFRAALGATSIVHIHNFVSPSTVKFVVEHCRSDVEFVYQVHSPLREGPLYADKSNSFGIKFARKLVVAQMHPRFYPDFLPVPNIVTDEIVLPKPDDAMIRVMYSPFERRGGRWNGKCSDELDRVIEELKYRDNVRVISPDSPMPSHSLFHLRTLCDITVDEIVTGGFHQISMEGLRAGNAVINGADEISLHMMESWANARPPFVICRPGNVREKILELIDTPDLLSETKSKSLEYGKNNLSPERNSVIFSDLYDDILKN